MFDYTPSEVSKPTHRLCRIWKPYRRYRPLFNRRIPQMIEFSRSMSTAQVHDIEQNEA